jgi:hypothetical protein
MRPLLYALLALTLWPLSSAHAADFHPDPRTVLLRAGLPLLAGRLDRHAH